MKREMPEMIENPEDVIGLTQALIHIPSYVNTHTENKKGDKVPVSKCDRVDEINISEYILKYLRKYTTLQVAKQQVQDRRFNVIASNSQDPELLLLGHLDTVKPSVSAKHDNFAGQIDEGKLYGLGAADMKSGLACMLSAIAMEQKLPNMMALFYIDEEYDFLGMKKFVDEYTNLRPRLILSADGGGLEMGYGCRGIIEIHGTVLGTAAHAAQPHLGVNAIEGTVNIFDDLKRELEQFDSPDLGSCTVNLARLDGGKAEVDPETGLVKIKDQANSVPDISLFVVDIRTSSPEVNPNLVLSKLEKYRLQRKLTLQVPDITLNLGSWFTDKSDLVFLAEIVKKALGDVKFGSPKDTGYIDLQMFWDALGRNIPATTFGPGEFSLAHKPDEYVEIDKLIKCRNTYREVLRSFVVK